MFKRKKDYIFINSVKKIRMTEQGEKCMKLRKCVDCCKGYRKNLKNFIMIYLVWNNDTGQ